MVDDHHQKTALGVVIAFPVLGGIAILLRLWARSLSRSRLASDDYLIIAGYILAVCQSVTSWYYIKTNYVGIHIWDVPKDHDVKRGLIWNYANQLIYNPCLTLIKVSILMFLRRLDSHSRVVNGLIWTSFAIVVGLFIAVLFVDIFQCHPVAYVYDLSIPGGTCIAQGAFYVSTAALNLFTDLMVLTIPIIITWRLQMPLRRKIAVCAILCMGAVATGIGVWRLVVLAGVFFPSSVNPDPTYAISFCSSAIEVNVAVITACGPSFRAIATKYLPRLIGSSGKHTSRYGTSLQREDGYEMTDRNGKHRVDVTSGDAFNMRKYRRGGDSPSISSGSEEAVEGIVKTTDVSVRYTVDDVHTSEARSHEGRHVSVDSLV
ncbi:hypothetical protein N7470_005166 [Penicillium chermesinum]|nr:hypothetical protein N7470_005166 [Penicillium chermesinum]